MVYTGCKMETGNVLCGALGSMSGRFMEDCRNSWNQLLELLEALSLEAASRQRRGLQSLPGPLQQMQIGSDLQLSRSLVCAFGAF